MRINRERNVVLITTITTCALATALWLAGVASHAASRPLKAQSTGAAHAPILSTLTARSLILEGVVLTSNQVEIKTWTVQGRTYVYLKLLLPNSGYSVIDWGQVVRVGNDSSADALVDRTNGPSVKAVTTTAQIYDLGPLVNGNYTFTFKNSGHAVKSLAFSISSAIPPPNPIDNAREFVKQQYRDFLNREADQAGEDFWTDNITKCSDPARRPAGQTEAECTTRQKETTSGAFFQSPEFQYTGYFVYRMYQGALGRQPKLSEFTPDAQFVGAGIVVNGQLSGPVINRNKADFTQQFVDCTDPAKYRCSEFKAIYDGLNNQQYVDKLFQTTGINAGASDRAALVNGLNAATETRASVLQKVVDGIVVISEGNQQFTTSYGQAFYNSEFRRAFVQLEYFGYMKRDPDQAGYAFWLAKLNSFGGDFVKAEMVLAFSSSPEYRERFMVAAKGSTVVIDKPSLFFPASGPSTQLSAQLLDPQGAPSAGGVSWISTAPDKVSVDATGKVVAKAIGSAQIIAEAAGVRSMPTLVIVAQPQPGALLVADAQVVSVGPPLRLPAGASPGVGTEYEVTLRNVSPPTPGTVMLAAETAPVAGKVVSTRQEAAGLVVTLALAPLYQLFSAYDLTWNIDLSAFPVDAVPAQSAQAAQSAVWNAERNKPGAPATTHQLAAFEPFRAFDCDGSIKPQLVAAPIQLSLENKLTLVVEDRPGYSKHALEGSAALVGNAGLKLKAGFKASGKCEAKAQIKLPVFGAASVLVMPAVHVGLGAELEGEILLVQGELGVEGKVGFSPVVGWECGGATPACRGLDDITPVNQFKTKSKIPSANDMQAKVSAQFYVLAGLDLAILGGVANAEILEARVGPKQSFDLAFEEDQPPRGDYASNYDLKIEGVVEPGSALKKAIEMVIDDDSTGVSFKAEFSFDISESPKGTHSVSKVKVRPGEPVDFTVDLDQKTVAYFLLGYNVTGVELYRKREDELDFKPWKSMSLIATNRATYQWVPAAADAGKYEFAALVNTQIPVPLLEVAPNSIRPVEVSCFGSNGLLAPKGTQSGLSSTVCADTWAGTATVVGRTPGAPASDNITTNANVTWTYDQTDPSGTIIYKPSGGSFTLAFNFPSTGCTTALSPNTFAIVNDPITQPKLIISNLPFVGQTYGIRGSQLVNFTSTTSCPGKPDVVNTVNNYLVDYAFGNGPFTGQARLFGSFEDAHVTYTWDFSRP